MLKRNLTVLTIISLSIVFTGHVFGQKSKRKAAKNSETTSKSGSVISGPLPNENIRANDVSMVNPASTQRIGTTGAKLTDDEYLDFGIEFKAKNKPAAPATTGDTRPTNARTASPSVQSSRTVTQIARNMDDISNGNYRKRVRSASTQKRKSKIKGSGTDHAWDRDERKSKRPKARLERRFKNQ